MPIFVFLRATRASDSLMQLVLPYNARPDCEPVGAGWAAASALRESGGRASVGWLSNSGVLDGLTRGKKEVTDADPCDGGTTQTKRRATKLPRCAFLCTRAVCVRNSKASVRKTANNWGMRETLLTISGAQKGN